jgi:putative thioredoxin
MRQDGVMQQPRNFSLHGAVDLGARQSAAQRRQQAAQPAGDGPGAGTAAHVIDVTDETFNTEVAERSRTVPVIMDLWAEWCGPCKQLSPVLEKLAAEADGAWVLAKVDVDANPQLSAALQVQSIPMVVAVVGGQIVDGFLGALPEAQVRQWLGRIMQAASQLGLPGAVAAAGEPAEQADLAAAQPPDGPADAMPGLVGEELAEAHFGRAQEAMERGDLDGAAEAFEKVLAEAPGHPVATMGLAQVALIRRVNSYDQASARQDAQDNPDDADMQARAADIDLAMGRIDDGFDRLLGVVRRTAGQERDKARRHLLGLFEIFPPRDPRVTKARSALSSLLF